MRWSPDGLGPRQELGAIMSDGAFIPNPSPSKQNRLMGNANPIVQRMGMFCATVPPELPPDTAVFGGLEVALQIAHLHPELVDTLLRALHDDEPDRAFDNPAVGFAQAIVEGRFPDGKKFG